ncbi:MAG: DNA translocase FtsK [Firmicutes bacterium]|nr:DNA translocase FtsK [Bacillota bacterium]
MTITGMQKNKTSGSSGRKTSVKASASSSLSPEAREKKSGRIRELSGLSMMFAGVFLFVCFILPQSTGIVGKTLWGAFSHTFGWGSYLFPWIIIYAGLHLTLKGSILSWKWAMPLIAFLYLDAVILTHLVNDNGGVVGKFLTSFITKIIGKTGGFFLVIFTGLILLLLITQLSVRQVLKALSVPVKAMGRFMKKFWHFISMHDENKAEKKKENDEDMEEIPDLSGAVKVKAKTGVKEKPAKKTETLIKAEPVVPKAKQGLIPDEDFLASEAELELDMEEPEDYEDEEEIVEPVKPLKAQEPPKPKKVIFYEEEDFPEDDDYIPPTPVPVVMKARDSMAESAAENVDTDEPFALEIDTFEITGGKPSGYEQIDMFGDAKPVRKIPAADEPVPPRLAPRSFNYKLPPLNLLRSAEKSGEDEQARDYSPLLEETLANFGVTVKVINIVRGPTVTRYELQPAKGVKVSKVTNLANDIALALAAYSIRIEAPIPGKSAIGIEVPNHRIDPVFLRDILFEAKYKKHSPLSLALGKDIAGNPVMGDLLKMPHLLIAGATGSGKSVCINSVIGSILYKATPLDVQMIMVDPKRVELSLFEGIPHLVDIKLPGGKKIITDPKAATLALKTVSEIMDRRYEDFVALKVRNIKEYNEKADEAIPYILIVIDELADLMMVSSSTVEQYICRIAQLGRASGIHLIVATQRPSVDVITGLIKANIPSRIAFAVSSMVDSRTILDRSGAEKLLGKGDMLYLPVDASEPRRIQGAYVSGEEIENVVEFWKQQPPPENNIPIELELSASNNHDDNDGEDDELLNEAIEIIKMTRQASVSNLQRKMKIGYARAGRMMDQLERKGIVGPADGSKPRKIMLPGFTDME